MFGRFHIFQLQLCFEVKAVAGDLAQRSSLCVKKNASSGLSLKLDASRMRHKCDVWNMCGVWVSMGEADQTVTDCVWSLFPLCQLVRRHPQRVPIQFRLAKTFHSQSHIQGD